MNLCVWVNTWSLNYWLRVLHPSSDHGRDFVKMVADDLYFLCKKSIVANLHWHLFAVVHVYAILSLRSHLAEVKGIVDAFERLNVIIRKPGRTLDTWKHHVLWCLDKGSCGHVSHPDFILVAPWQRIFIIRVLVSPILHRVVLVSLNGSQIGSVEGTGVLWNIDWASNYSRLRNYIEIVKGIQVPRMLALERLADDWARVQHGVSKILSLP